MRTRSKLILAALTATILLGLAVSSASATRLSILNFERGFRIAFTSLELSNNVGLATVRCPVTLEGTFHRRSITKTSGLLIGYITRAIVRGNLAAGECTGGRASIAVSLPWHVRFASFTGTLPSITAIRVQIVGARFTVEPLGSGLACNSRTTEREPAFGTFATRSVGGLLELERATASGEIALEGAGLCVFGRGIFAGTTTSVTILGGTTRLAVSLI